jgi:hypothetical protein
MEKSRNAGGEEKEEERLSDLVTKRLRDEKSFVS